MGPNVTYRLPDHDTLKSWIRETLIESGRWDATTLDDTPDHDGLLFTPATIADILVEQMECVGVLQDLPGFAERTGMRRNVPLIAWDEALKEAKREARWETNTDGD